MIKHQVIAILKMRIAKILLLLLITLNLISFISLNNQKTDFENDVNNKVQETIALKQKFKSLRIVYQYESDESWNNFFSYLDWKINCLENLAGQDSIDTYYKCLLEISSVDIDCYANDRVGDFHFKSIKPKEFDQEKYEFNRNTLNTVFAKANTSSFIHQLYVNEVSHMKLMYQRVYKNSFLDKSSLLGYLLNNLKADSILSFLLPVLIVIFTITVLNVYQDNNLHQLLMIQSRRRYLFRVVISVCICLGIIYCLSFFAIGIALLKNHQFTKIDTKILVDQVNIFKFNSYVHGVEKMYYMGNEYFASADTLFTIPECLSLMPIWKVLSLLEIMNIIKTLFYTSATTLIFLCTRKKKNFKTVCIASSIIIYCISQFGLLFPCVNPLAIVSSFSLICGGYEITWLYGMIELTLYTLLLYLFIRKRIRKVDF